MLVNTMVPKKHQRWVRLVLIPITFLVSLVVGLAVLVILITVSLLLTIVCSVLFFDEYTRNPNVGSDVKEAVRKAVKKRGSPNPEDVSNSVTAQT